MLAFDGTRLSEWLSYLEQLHPIHIDMGLSRIKQVCDAMGLLPTFPVISVAGTNGKGSVCMMLSHMLCAAGYVTGTYTSPHLYHYKERVKINLCDVTEDRLLAAFHRIELARGKTTLTYFEFGTLAAMHIFMDQQVDIAILEVGLGGRLDAVNVFEPDVSAVVSIGMDHEHYLGSTREQISFEKAGVYRTAKPAFCGDPDPPQTLIDYAHSIGAKLRLLGRDYGFLGPFCEKTPLSKVALFHETASWTWWGHHQRHDGLPLPALEGEHQLGNASLALAILEAISGRFPVDLMAIKQALLEVKWPGRFQIVPGYPVTILDVGHNPHAAVALRACLTQMPILGRTFAVFGMMADKDIAGVVKILGDQIDVWHLAAPNISRAASTQELTQIISNILPCAVVVPHHTLSDAWYAARDSASQEDRILVFGSFYTVAEVGQFTLSG